MASTYRTTEAVVHQPLRDFLNNLLNMSLAKRDIGSVTASDTGLRISTAASYTINGRFYNKAASSAVFALSGTALTAGQRCKWLLSLDSNGNGTATQGTIAVTEANAVLPNRPENQCPVGQVEIVAAAPYTPGTTTFSQVISSGGSVTVTEFMTMNVEK